MSDSKEFALEQSRDHYDVGRSAEGHSGSKRTLQKLDVSFASPRNLDITFVNVLIEPLKEIPVAEACSCVWHDSFVLMDRD
jgi:hypothetical protein